MTALPPEVMRRGRFDEVFFLDLPTVHLRTCPGSWPVKSRPACLAT